MNAPGRLFLSVKMALSDSAYTGTNIFGARWSIEELIGLMLRQIKERIETTTGETVDEIVIGRPVHYSADTAGDTRAVQRMQHAAELAGLRAVRFLPEPTAAAMHYVWGSAAAGNVVVFDFGGGTLDVTVMRLDRGGSYEILATDGVPVGGDLMDRRIVMGKLVQHFGAGAGSGRDGCRCRHSCWITWMAGRVLSNCMPHALSRSSTRLYRPETARNSCERCVAWCVRIMACRCMRWSKPQSAGCRRPTMSIWPWMSPRLASASRSSAGTLSG